MFVQRENKMLMKERGDKEGTRGKPKRCHKSEGWRRDRQKEKILLERSAQSTSVKERHWDAQNTGTAVHRDSKLQYEPLFFCAWTCTVQVWLCDLLLELRVCLVLALVQYASITFRIWASSSRAAVPEKEKMERKKNHYYMSLKDWIVYWPCILGSDPRECPLKKLFSLRWSIIQLQRDTAVIEGDNKWLQEDFNLTQNDTKQLQRDVKKHAHSSEFRWLAAHVIGPTS